MVDKRTISVYDQQSETYRDLISRQSSDPTLLAFIRRIKPGGFVLDLGCGPATASAAMREQGLRVDPVDASVEMISLANDTHDISARVATFEDIDVESTYDGIWANFSLLHVPASDFARIVSALHRALKPGGIFHLGMKTGSGAGRDRLGRYYVYYSEEELIEILDSAAFDVIETKVGEGRGLAGDLSPWVAFSCLAMK